SPSTLDTRDDRNTTIAVAHPFVPHSAVCCHSAAEKFAVCSCLPTPIHQNRHFDRSCSQFHHEQRSGEIRSPPLPSTKPSPPTPHSPPAPPLRYPDRTHPNPLRPYLTPFRTLTCLLPLAFFAAAQSPTPQVFGYRDFPQQAKWDTTFLAVPDTTL